MADEISQEVKLLRAIMRTSETNFVSYSADERDTKLYNKNTTSGIKATATISAESLQSFTTSDGKVKYLFKIEDS
tara:strand:- start:4354 stop:4578 length:225 start_codon:yes stop_codon:yes gene_type:complete